MNSPSHGMDELSLSVLTSGSDRTGVAVEPLVDETVVDDPVADIGLTIVSIIFRAQVAWNSTDPSGRDESRSRSVTGNGLPLESTNVIRLHSVSVKQEDSTPTEKIKIIFLLSVVQTVCVVRLSCWLHSFDSHTLISTDTDVQVGPAIIIKGHHGLKDLSPDK